MKNIIQYETKLLNTYTDKWRDRAQVRKTYYPFDDIALEPERSDFLTELLPFSQHPLWENADFFLKKKLTSWGWIVYNKKTIHIETEIVMPICDDMVQGKLTMLDDDRYKQMAAQTLIDESYHTLLSVQGCAVISEFRNLSTITLPPFQLITQLKESLKHADGWQQTLIRLGAAVSSEMLVSDYLACLSQSQEVQPFCCATTQAHWRDETAHAGIFSLITRSLFPQLAPSDQRFLIDVIKGCSQWFNDKEFSVWLPILKQLEFPDAETMLAECQKYTSPIIHTQKLNHLIQSFTIKQS